MLIASLIDAGISNKLLEKELQKRLKMTGWSLEVNTTQRHHFPAKLLSVKGDITFRSPYHMREIISDASFTPETKSLMLKILDNLIAAEAKVHNIPPSKIHFHELNSIDTLVDITGFCYCLELLGISQVHASPLNVGRPAPATIEILKKCRAQVYSDNPAVELTTPTGAAILSTISKSFGNMPELKIEKSGFGAGHKIIEKTPNILNALIGAAGAVHTMFETDEVILIETNIDDMDPRLYPHVMEKLFLSGAKDVWLTQVLMKKGRPGIILSALSSIENESELARIIFRETTTLGIRRQSVPRFLLNRETKPGKKIARLPGGETKIKSEYETTRQKAIKTSTPLIKILY